MPQFDLLNLFIIFNMFFGTFILIEMLSFYISKALIVHQLYLSAIAQINKRFAHILKKK